MTVCHVLVKKAAMYHSQIAKEAEIVESGKICLNLKKACDLAD